MGTTYYGVRKIIENGQRIGSASPNKPLGIGDGVLVGIVNTGVWAVALDLTQETEYQTFYDSYSKGMWLNMDLYKVPRGKIGDCPDEGRVSLRELEQFLKANPSK